MAATTVDVIREFVALNECYVSGALPVTALERWSDLIEVVDGELARCNAERGGIDCRRLYTRAPLRLPIRFSAASLVGMGETFDLSCAGCAIESRCPLPPHAEIQLSVRLPWGLGTLRPSGQIRWTAPARRSGTWHSGVGFEPLARWETEALASCVLGVVAPGYVADA
jgi:hypothetical protein